MNTEDVAVYTVANQSYARLFSFTSPTARKLGNSIRYPEMEAMYTDLKERRVFINKTMDERYPLMAQAIYAEDEMQIILMLWGLPWDRMNLAESNRLTVISYSDSECGCPCKPLSGSTPGAPLSGQQQHFGKRGIYTAGKCVF